MYCELLNSIFVLRKRPLCENSIFLILTFLLLWDTSSSTGEDLQLFLYLCLNWLSASVRSGTTQRTEATSTESMTDAGDNASETKSHKKKKKKDFIKRNIQVCGGIF